MESSCRDYLVMLLHSTKMHSIINNASIQGIQSQKGVSAYAATKGAILSLTRQLAVEYGDHQIRGDDIFPYDNAMKYLFLFSELYKSRIYSNASRLGQQQIS